MRHLGPFLERNPIRWALLFLTSLLALVSTVDSAQAIGAIHVFGDSYSSTNHPFTVWPKMVAQSTRSRLVDHAHSGAFVNCDIQSGVPCFGTQIERSSGFQSDDVIIV